jgi:hypothetical protein
MNKCVTAAQNARALDVLHRTGMLADFGLIFFDPDSTVEDVRANLDFLHSMAGDGQAPLSFGRLEVYAGTPIEARLLREGRLSGNYLAWNYTIADPRVELLFRLMIATMYRRHYPNQGIGKQVSIACYEYSMYRHALGSSVDPRLGESLRAIVARLNRHSLATLEEMLIYVREENLYDTKRVNDQVMVWGSRVNLFDLELAKDLAAWRELLNQQVPCGLR